jgi:aspartate aminotransferase
MTSGSSKALLSQRLARVGESATMSLARRVIEKKAAGEELIDLGAGEPDFDSPAVAVAAASEALARGYTRYTHVAGDPDLRAALAQKYAAVGAPWSGEQVLVTVGAKAALLELALALCDEHDEVIIPSPCWVSLPEQVRLAGGEPVLVPMRAEGGFAIEPEPLLAAVTARTKAILINAPCNPTGAVISAEDLTTLVSLAAKRGLLVISDETYERFVYDGREPVTVAQLAARYPETVVLVGSFSKTYAMTGWRLGYLLGPAPIVAAARTIQSHATSNVTSFAMRGALAALEGAEEWVRERIAEYEARRDLVVAGLTAIDGVRCPPPAGTFYAFPDVSAHFSPSCPGSTELAEQLLERTGVVVVPGSAFGEDRCVRLSFAASRQELARGIERLSEVLRPASVGGGPR